MGPGSLVSHFMADEQDYVTAYAEARNGFQSAGRRFEWNVPKSMEHLKDENE
jgi:hypothetical protein